jgi:lactoylglutathione lyase
MERSVDFYTKVLGMKVLKTFDNPKERYSLTFIGFGQGLDTSVIELTYNYGVSEYEQGTGFGHIAIDVDDCIQACANIRERGGKVTLEPKKLDEMNEIIAFVEDPDGYQLELVQSLAS